MIRIFRRLLASGLYRARGGQRRLHLSRRYPQFEIGRASYGDLSVLEFGDGGTLRVGAYCSFAKGVQIFLGGEHRTDWVTTYPFSAMDPRFFSIRGHPRTRGDVIVGNDVWFGREAMVMSGVRIGDGAVIGARALVTRDVSPYAIVSGNPAKEVRHRFPPQVVERLLAVAWWEWPEARIEAAMPSLLNNDIIGFLEAAEAGRL